MTIIIGLYYDNGNGAIVLADSRTMRGGDYTQDQKLFRVDKDVIFALFWIVWYGSKTAA